MRICVDSPIPSIDTILKAVLDNIGFPPRLPDWPKLPSLPNPLFAGIRMPNLEMITMAIELQAFQLQTTLLGMIKPMLSLIGTAIEDFLPKIPGLGLTLLDLLAGTPDKIIEAITNAIKRGFRWPGIPIPFFPSIMVPVKEAVHIMQQVVGNYMQTLAMMVVNLISKVTDKLKIPMIEFPKIPTVDEIMQMVLGGLPDFDALLENFKGNIEGLFDMLSNLKFPGLPKLPKLPSPLIPNIRIPAIELKMAITALMNNLVVGLMKPIMDFIEGTLSKFLSFTFPKICITI